MRRSLAIVLLAAVQMACAAAPTLRGTTWVLSPKAEAGNTPTLVFDTAQLRVSGQAQCNRIMGSFTVDGDKLSLGQVVSTRRACYPDDGSEQRFLQALSQVQRWRIEGGELLLFGAEGSAPLLRLKAAP
jgi:copper homeostasis protein (lipoprotein)